MRDLELVFLEEDGLSLVSDLLGYGEQSWKHVEAATNPAAAGVGLYSYFDRLIAHESVAEDPVA
jgi:hypothetical protein